jgi:hypothetical protein
MGDSYTEDKVAGSNNTTRRKTLGERAIWSLRRLRGRRLR